MNFQFLESWFLGSRKFIVMLAILFVAIAFRLRGYLSGTDFTDLVKTVGVSFMGSNAVEHMCLTVKDWLAGKVSDNEPE